MSRHLLHLWIALVALLSGLDLSGCSVIGLEVGAAIDNGARHYVSQEPRRAPAIPLGAQIILLLTDSTRVSGRLEGSRRMPDEAYAPRYSAWREALPDSERLPAFGEQITLDVMNELPKAGLFHRAHHAFARRWRPGLPARGHRALRPVGETADLLAAESRDKEWW